MKCKTSAVAHLRPVDHEYFTLKLFLFITEFGIKLRQMTTAEKHRLLVPHHECQSFPVWTGLEGGLASLALSLSLSSLFFYVLHTL